MQKKETFGEYLRRLRDEHGLPLRKVAALLDIDPSTLSKIERNERFISREMIIAISTAFNVSEKELLISFLSDKIASDLVSEENSTEILHIAEEKIKYLRQLKMQQGKISF